MSKWLLRIMISLYLLICIIVTFCLFSFNDYGVLEIGNNNYIITSDNFMDYKNGTLLSLEKVNDYSSLVDNSVYYIDGNGSIREGTVRNVNAENNVLKLDISKQYYLTEQIIGISTSAKSYAEIGTIISILTNKYIYSFGIVFPLFLIVVYAMIVLIKYKRRKK